MRSLTCLILLCLFTCFFFSGVQAHPGSGIVVDRSGDIYFVDTGAGVWKIDRAGSLERVEGPAYHWMAIDRVGGFSGVRLPRSLRGDVSVVGSNPTLIAGGDFPLTVGADRAMYYPQAAADGPVRILRLKPSGSSSVFATLPDAFETGPEGERLPACWIHGLAADSGGSLYYTERRAVRRINPNGTVSLVAGDVTVPHCSFPPALQDDPHLAPDLRGLAVAPDGTVYVAASACSALLAIAPTGDVSVVLRASDAWSPMGVAVAGADLYVLEYRYIASDRREDWLPRVRKVAKNGTVTVVATVSRR